MEKAFGAGNYQIPPELYISSHFRAGAAAIVIYLRRGYVVVKMQALLVNFPNNTKNAQKLPCARKMPGASLLEYRCAIISQ